MRDHPRTCGETISDLAFDAVGLGSPPHMRGKEILAVVNAVFVGITPAHAGKRDLAFSFSNVPRDHPRTCGEKAGEDRVLGCQRWITPAHAGKRL